MTGLVLQLPHHGPRTQLFGNRQPDGQPHAGDDFGFTDGSRTYPDVFAAAAGVVLYAGDSRALGWPNPYYLNPDFDRSDAQDSSAGNVVVIGHGNHGVTTYSHLEAFKVAKGAVVAAGQVIAVTGSTGYSFGKHLHFEWIPYPFDFGTATYGRVRPVFSTISPQGIITRGALMALSDKEQTELLAGVRELLARTAPVKTGPANKPVFTSFRQFLVNGVRAAEAARDNTGPIMTGSRAKPVPVPLRVFLAQGTRAAQGAEDNTEQLLADAAQDAAGAGQ